MTRLAIVHTESSLGWGGQEIRILSESQGLIRRGHDVKLICAPEARIYSEAKNWGVPAIALPIAKKRPVGVKVLVEWLKRNRCDVLSAHSSTDSWLAALALLALGRPVRMVRTRHISAPVPRNMLSRWLYTRATARIVTAGESLRRELIERNQFAAERIDSVPTGIDASRFTPGDPAIARAALKLPQDKTLVGIVATLRSWKGHRYLIEAVAQLPQSIGLVIVGDGPQREALDIFALPSYANEGVPQALVQAMLVGLPCVTTNAGSIAELAAHESTALVVPARDPGALRDAIDKLAANPDFRKNLGAAARRHCSQHLSYETMLDRMEAIYRQVSGKRA
ncbi:MAG: glycosyltransferase family 4 protein [Betaproteobacteria bacterium]|nr:MAG: glycosyltransferase family 4 protein [Betaproteobacteria bacterium]